MACRLRAHFHQMRLRRCQVSKSSQLQPWFEARKRFRLSHAQIQMARELGMNPRNFGSLANHKQEPWKLPLPQFIEECYEKRFGRPQPESIRTLEEVIQADERKRAQKQQKKAVKRALAADNSQTGAVSIPPPNE